VISNAEVFTGGFSAEYGGRISSVIDITTRDGNKKEVKGHVGLNPFGAKFQIEGPLKKLRENGSGISYVLSAKNSYLDQSSKLFYPYVNNGTGLPFRYTDIYGKISTSGASGSKFNAFGFNFSDGVSSYRKLASLNWRNTGYGGNFVVSPSSSAVLISGVFARSDYEIRMKEENNPDRYSKITSFNFGLNFKYNIDKDALKYGIEVVGFSTDFSTYTPLGYKVQEQQNTTELNAFVDYKFNRGRWVIEPSLRFQYYGTLAVFSPEPRIGLKFKQSDRLRFKAAAGKYTQNLMATNSDRDVVNLFYGFLASPENLPGEYTNSNYEVQKIQNVLQTAYHLIGGFEYDLTENWNINVEGYYRNFTQLTNVNRNKIFDMADEDKPAELRYDYIIETGQAYGCDFVSKYQTKDIIINMVYSLAKVRRWDGYAYYAPVFDRRHNVNFVGTYIMGEHDEYEFSVRWNLGSGLPFTQTQGFYNGQNSQQGIGLDYVSNNSQFLTVQYATLN
ncbi:MAG: TonB-dependent receptor plug domain-containing protein, partial [Flavobacteriales bacterium]